MKPNTLRWLGVTAAATAAVLCWYFLSMKPDSVRRTQGKGRVAPVHASGHPPASKSAGPMPRFGTPEFNSVLLDRGRKWLDSRGRDAAGLIAMWDLTGDRTFLDEAAEKFPNDPRVCTAMIYQTADVVHKAIPWIDRLLAAEPNNPEGAFLKARTLMATHDRAGALETLRQAAAMSVPRETYVLARIMAAGEAARAMGVSPGDSMRLAFGRPLEKSTVSQTFEGATHAIMGGIDAAKNAGSYGDVMEIAGIGLVTAEKFSDARPLTILDEWSANRLKKYILACLPDDAEIGESGRSARSLRAEVEERGKFLQQLIQRRGEVAALLEAADDDRMISYANSLLARGEADARNQLLLEQLKMPK
jgi:hypothetical protein